MNLPQIVLFLFAFSLLESSLAVVETVPAVRVVRFQVDYPDADVSLVSKHNKWTAMLRNSVLASLRFINKHWLICGGTELEKRTNDCGKLQVTGEVVDNNHYRVNMTFVSERDPIRNSKVDATSTVFGVVQIGLKGGIFQYTNALRALGKPAQTLGFDEAFFCYRGSTLYQQDKCRLCESGYSHNESLNRCVPCPKGTYQSHSGRGYCISCGYSYTTADVGSKSIDQCILECQPGYRLDTKENQCVPCGLHHFQPSKGQNSCLRCPEGTVASTVTATSRAECLLTCGAGKQRMERLNVCELCPKGTYKSERDLVCHPCPEAVTTTVAGATDINQCNLPNCEPGFYLDVRKRRCEPCALGEFQEEKGATSCRRCKSGFTTKALGAKSDLECVSTNQCTNGEHRCHWLAQCFDLPDGEGTSGTYGCKCHPGFVGNGFQCVDVCFNYCENGGKCVKNANGLAKCVCLRGFVGRRCEVFDS